MVWPGVSIDVSARVKYCLGNISIKSAVVGVVHQGVLEESFDSKKPSCCY